jgi:hypothetical protein
MNFEKILNECGVGGTVTSDSFVDAVPESPIKILEVHNGENKMELKETTINRLYNRLQLNEQLFSSINNKSLNKDIESISILKEATVDAAKSWILMKEEENKRAKNNRRYELQKWANGGGGDGTEKGQPSAYEQWRAGILEKKITKREAQEDLDRNSPYASPTHTDVSEETWDNQVDAFLGDWIKKQRG